ncbi:MAG: hypothetical protein Q7U64_01195 [Desulfocapsaceae bacterium]|nr:hypothetical protein [Desulfocapsaceae bacterium]
MFHFPYILFVVFIFIGLQYLLEVRIGSSICMYDGESGLLSPACPPRKSSACQFMGIAVPLQLGAIGLPLLACDLLSGILLIMLSLFLFCLCRKKLSTQKRQLEIVLLQ